MRYIGIDLGTTFSAVAFLDDTGSPKIIKDGEGNNITPSCVAQIKGTFEVGERARRHWGNAPDEAAARFKRDMGTEKSYSVCGEALSPTDLSGEVLRHMKEIATDALGNNVSAVVTIPANFAHEAREATMQAAKEAGLNIKHIINEPTAAALYYAYAEQEELQGIYAVYDLGGGTFDVSIINVNGSDVEVLSSHGVSKLGGDDFDKALLELVQEKYQEQEGKTFEEDDFTLNDAEEEKINLSRRKRTTAQIGRTFIDIRREDFEEKISALIAQTEMLCESALDEAGITADSVQAVFLAGGSTRSPIVRESVIRIFGKEPIATANVDEVVALGAALYSAYKSDGAGLSPSQAKSLEAIKVAEAATMCFGTSTLSWNDSKGADELQNDVLIARGEKIPCSVTKTYYTVSDNQTSLNCTINESRTPERNVKFVKNIWTGDLELPEGRPAGQPIEITFSFTENQIMAAEFKDVETGKTTNIELSVSGESQKAKDGSKFLV